MNLSLADGKFIGKLRREIHAQGFSFTEVVDSTVEDMARIAAFEVGEGPGGVLGSEALSDNFERGARMNPRSLRATGWASRSFVAATW